MIEQTLTSGHCFIDEITGGDLPNGEDSYRNIIAAYLGTENNSALTDSVMAQYPLSNFNDDVSLAYSAFVLIRFSSVHLSISPKKPHY